MSDSQTQPHTPTPKPARRGTSLWLWALLLLVAIAATAGAVWYAGGPSAVAQMVSASGLSIPGLGGGGSPAPSSAPPVRGSRVASSSADATVTTLPPAAQQRMFAEQSESRDELAELVGGKIATIRLGTPILSESSASVPVTAVYSAGPSISGTMTFEKFHDAWYFFSLSRDADKSASTDAGASGKFDSRIVSTITSQQAQAGSQDMISKGLLGGGYRTVDFGAVQLGPRTASVDVSLSGGDMPAAKGELVCISKTDGGTTYWFVASFEKR